DPRCGIRHGQEQMCSRWRETSPLTGSSEEPSVSPRRHIGERRCQPIVTSHPDAAALAFFAEKLLESDEEHDVAAHIESCDRCAATLEDLTEVSKVLATVSPPALPQELTDLLDRQITEAARERTATGISEPSVPPSPRDGAAPPLLAFCSSPRRRSSSSVSAPQ